ncbi:RmlD substrate binding domain protein [compost metagenome]
MRQGRTIKGFSDSSFTPISIHTLSRKIASIERGDAGKILHFLSAPPVTKYDFLRQVAASLGVSAEKVQKGSIDEAKFAAQRPRRQDLQTRAPKKRAVRIQEELELSLPSPC